MQDRQRETGGLAGAGLRPGQQVAAGQYLGDRLSLNRSGFRVSRVGNRAQQGVCQIQAGEGGFIVRQDMTPV